MTDFNKVDHLIDSIHAIIHATIHFHIKARFERQGATAAGIAHLCEKCSAGICAHNFSTKPPGLKLHILKGTHFKVILKGQLRAPRPLLVKE